MNWDLAIEKNREALRRILAMLVAMVSVSGNADASLSHGVRSATLPRHLHRLVLRLLRPAEAATRRLIIIAARGLVIDLPRPRQRKPRPLPQPRTVLVLDRIDGRMVSVPMVLPEPVATPVRRRPGQGSLALPLLDPLKRFGVRRIYLRPAVRPRIRAFGDQVAGFAVPLSSPDPVAPSPDDPLDPTRLHRRLDSIASALDDLPGHATRLARWQARRDANLARDRSRDADETSTANPLGIGGAPDKVQARGRRRFQRLSPMRPGRPPGWRRKNNHEVYEVLNELHGLAVYLRNSPDTS